MQASATTIHLGSMPDGTPILGRCTAPAPQPDRRPLPRRMADDMLAAYDARGVTTEDDMARAGWTPADIATHGPEAGALMRRDLGTRRNDLGA